MEECTVMELVAEEVRRLACRSADNASRIERRLRAIQNSPQGITGSAKGDTLLINTQAELSNEIRSTVAMLDALVGLVEHYAGTAS